jgi:hypothetical protein
MLAANVAVDASFTDVPPAIMISTLNVVPAGELMPKTVINTHLFPP